MKFKDYLKYLGLGAVTASAGIGAGLLITDTIKRANSSKGEGLPLFNDGVHLKKGNHRVVLTDQFCELLSYDTKEDAQKLIVDGMGLAYKNLNEMNSGIKFEFCTTYDDFANKFDIPKIEEVENSDIPLYLTTDIIDNNKNVLASTKSKIMAISRELVDGNITFRKDAMTRLWTTYGSPEKVLNPLNTFAYTITAHESMHLMGFAHIEEDSIMGTYLNFKIRDFTEKDKELIDKYNVEFYGTTPKYQNQSVENEELSF